MTTSRNEKALAGRWYDEMATNCEGCGWLRMGTYTDGMPYLACYWFGTIMSRRSDAQCGSWTSPVKAAKEIERQAKLERERWEMTAATRKRKAQQFNGRENESE